MPILFIITFVILILLGVPIAFAMGIVTMGAYFLLGGNLQVLPQRLIAGIDSFPLLAIPLFIFAGQIMNKSGISMKLVRFCDNLIGHITGGLGHVNVLASMLFAGLTGSATADAAGLGSIEIPMMVEGGYDRDFSAGITAASAIIGPIIPPSIIMIIYAIVAGEVSVLALFLGGIIPGILLGLGLMIVCYIIAKLKKYPIRKQRVPFKELITSFFETIPVLLMPLIILGGILSGIFTPTESAAIAVLYAVIISIFFLKALTFRDLYPLLLETAKVTAAVLFIIAVATSMGWVITVLQIPQKVAALFLAYADSQITFLLFSNILLLIIGTLLDQGPAVLIMTPVLAPAAILLGIDPVHFGLVLIVNLCIGLVTPPIGMTLFITAGVAKISLNRMYKAIWPFLIVEVIVLFLITYIPATTTWIPGLFGQ